MPGRNFDFPISTLVRDSRRLLGALRDEKVGPPVAKRLRKKNADPAQPPLEYAPGFEAQVTLVEKGGTAQSGAIGDLGDLTEEEAAAYTDLERLMAGARRTADLAFPHNRAILHGEFQIGIHEPQDLASELERAGKICVACEKYLDSLAEHGWSQDDTDLLTQVIAALGGGDTEQEAARGRKKGLTQARTRAANQLYKMCLTVQNAARLSFPNTKTTDETIVEARARYLLDTFPPRGGASAGENPSPSGPIPVTAPK